MKQFTFWLLFFTLNCINAQPTLQWAKCYGGSNLDASNWVFATSDSGFVMVGRTRSTDGDVSGVHLQYDSASGTWFAWDDVSVIKTDASGNLLWQKSLGGSASDIGIAGVETQGGFVIACDGGIPDGDFTLNHGSSDYTIAKLDYSGQLLWQHSYGGFSSEEVYGMAAAPDGGFIITGTELSPDGDDILGHHGPVATDEWLIKTDSLGIILWQKCLGGTGQELFGSVQADSTGNIYLLATVSAGGDATCIGNNGSAWLVKLDAIGNIIWQKCFGGIVTGGGQIYSLQLKGNRLLMSGMTSASDGDLTHNFGIYDAWIIVTDTSGNKVFSQSYGGSNSEYFYDAKFTDDNMIVACGKSYSTDYQVTMNHLPWDSWIVLVDSLGNLLWENSYGGTNNEELHSLVTLPGGIFVCTGYTGSLNNGDISGHHGISDYWLLKFDGLNSIDHVAVQIHLPVYPQPFTDQFTVELPLNNNLHNSFYSLVLYDLNGRKIHCEIKVSGTKINVKPDESIGRGIYILELITAEKVFNVKIMKI